MSALRVVMAPTPTTDAARAEVQPLDRTISIEPGETLMAAASRQGLRWPTICGGDCECGTCVVVVESGAEHLAPPTAAESERLSLGRLAAEPRARLACQIRPTGPIRVFNRSVRVADRSRP